MKLSLEHAMSVHLTAEAREHVIARIMDARLLLVAFEEIRDGWTSPAERMGRGIQGQALIEKKRLQRASDALLCAELANLPAAY